MKAVTVEEVSSPGCIHCKAFEDFWHSIEKNWPNVTYKNISIMSAEGQALAQKHMIFASPGIVINGELFATGGVSKNQFLAKLTAISQD